MYIMMIDGSDQELKMKNLKHRDLPDLPSGFLLIQT